MKTLQYFVLFLLLHPLALHGAVILQYHRISDAGPEATQISPELFASHMAYLKQHNFQVVELSELVAKLQQGQPLPDRTVAITFDDGYRSVFTQALPVLRHYDWPFTLFLSTNPVDEKWHQFLSWDQVRELSRNGATIAGHTASHLHMLRQKNNETKAQWLDRIKQDIELAQSRIVTEVGNSPAWLAYPYGEYSPDLQQQLAAMGYIGFAQISGPISDHSSLTAIPRFAFGGSYGGADDFATKVSTLAMPVTRVAVTDPEGRALIDPVLPADTSRPVLRLSVTDPELARRINCFASGQGAIPVRVDVSNVVIQASQPLPVGRSRYNCTAASAEPGRFYWYSQLFIRRQADGTWYPEP